MSAGICNPDNINTLFIVDMNNVFLRLKSNKKNGEHLRKVTYK